MMVLIHRAVTTFSAGPLASVLRLTSVPSIPRERLWTRLAKMPGRLWAFTHDAATVFTDGLRRRPSKRKMLLIRLVLLASVVVLLPVTLLLGSRYRRTTAFDLLQARVRQSWATSAPEAIALLRSTFDELVAGGSFTDMSDVEIQPFGVFKPGDAFAVHRFLYDCEVSLGNFEEALVVSSALPGRLDESILRQVDCLVALGRQPEAIALLERNLDLDGWRGRLRRRLAALGGHLRAVK